ncbi:hypothetical protein [Stenotrophomonas sp. YAU14D1_LEIMI4_1]|uniref:hypothetical protein n=1 Tax=Stenotrophomonas sp. YAU14D1_LEIMI4_1 TaxID=2072407 RepID=UPI000D54169A|nr:hypothetical protein [Stenotrophomonas sp. YAU14D1_LEIMI4_1]AWH26647.1 hypothetical protein C1932_16825 [Stenotrophomonas sp. YAU14D1_LEIMI4_1]
MNARTAHRPSAERLRQRPDPRVLRQVQQLALAGVALVLVWPAARGHHAWLGWAPLWLVGMPLVAWWALLGCPLPLRAALRRLRGPQQQARRRPARRPRRARGQAATA